MVLVHHMPGWDQWYREVTLEFAHHGYATLTPNLYFRAGHGTPEDVAAKVRGEGGIPDDQAVGDLAGAMHMFVRCLIAVAKWEFSGHVPVVVRHILQPAGRPALMRS